MSEGSPDGARSAGSPLSADRTTASEGSSCAGLDRSRPQSPVQPPQCAPALEADPTALLRQLLEAAATERDAADKWWQLQVRLARAGGRGDGRVAKEAEAAASLLRDAERLRVSGEAVLRHTLAALPRPGELEEARRGSEALLDGARREAAALLSGREEAERRAAAAESALDRAQEEAAGLRMEAAELRAEAVDAAAEVEAASRRAAAAEASLAAAERGEEEATAAIADRVAELERCVEEHRLQYEESRRAVDCEAEKVSAAEARLSELRAELRSAEDRLGESAVLLAAADDRASAAELRAVHLEQDLAVASDAAAAAAVRSPDRDPDVLTLRLTEMEEEMDRMRTAAEIAPASLKEARAELDLATAELHRVRGERDTLAERLAARLDRLEGEAAMLQQQRGRRASLTTARPKSPLRAAAAGGSQTPRSDQTTPAVLGVEVANATPCRSDVRVDGVRVVAARRPSAPLVQDGDLIVRVCDAPTPTMADFRMAVQRLRPGATVPLTLRRRGGSGTSFLKTVDIKTRVRRLSVSGDTVYVSPPLLPDSETW